MNGVHDRSYAPMLKGFAFFTALIPGVLWVALEVLKEGSDGHDLDRLDSAQVEEVIVTADKPAYAGGHGAC